MSKSNKNRLTINLYLYWENSCEWFDACLHSSGKSLMWNWATFQPDWDTNWQRESAHICSSEGFSSSRLHIYSLIDKLFEKKNRCEVLVSQKCIMKVCSSFCKFSHDNSLTHWVILKLFILHDCAFRWQVTVKVITSFIKVVLCLTGVHLRPVLAADKMFPSCHTAARQQLHSHFIINHILV